MVDNLIVYGPVINAPKIVESIYDPSNECVDVVLITQVQYPYELVNPVIDIPNGWSATITQSSNGCVMVTGPSSQLCEQTWDVHSCQDIKCDDAVGLQLSLDAHWCVDFDVVCVSTFTGGCDVPEPSTNTVEFDTSSDNYCPRFIDEVSLTGSLESYIDPQRTIPTDEFVFGSKTYFRGVVNSKACLTHAHAECIEIITGGSTPNQKVYLDPLSGDVNTYFTTSTGSWSTEMSDPLVESVVINHNIPLDNCHKMEIDFEWVWSDVNSNAQGDDPLPTVVKLCARVRYKELDSSPSGRRLLEARKLQQTSNSVVRSLTPKKEIQVLADMSKNKANMAHPSWLLFPLMIAPLF